MCRCALVILLIAVGPGFAQVVSYDGTAFPEDTDGEWVRLDFIYQADRYISEDGWLVQLPEIVDKGPPVIGEQDFYRRELDDQAGLASWYLQWVMFTDGPEAFSAVAPASIVASGTSGIAYHFTIAADQLRLRRDAHLPMVFADFDPGPHVFRLELDGTESYSFTIDGVEIDTGVPEGAYPTSDSFIVFGARAAIKGNDTRWDYIEFGAPGPIPTVSTWGVAVMTALLLTAGTIVLAKRRSRYAGAHTR